MTEFQPGVDFDEDVRGFTFHEQKEVEGRNIPDGWHAVSIKSVKRIETEEEVRMTSLKPYYKSLYSVAFNVAVEGKGINLFHTELVAGKPLELTSSRTGNKYYPTASRLGSNLARASKINGNGGFQTVLDAVMTAPLFGKFVTSEAGYQSLERI